MTQGSPLPVISNRAERLGANLQKLFRETWLLSDRQKEGRQQ
ncbi:MAG TPA: hypothetical protein PL140_01295 [Ferrovaceae bacterium]|nr:hypothetical protein [Ferrovaceae bacterium]